MKLSGETMKVDVLDREANTQSKINFTIINNDYQAYMMDKEFEFKKYKPLCDKFSMENDYNFYKVSNEFITHYYCIEKVQDLR